MPPQPASTRTTAKDRSGSAKFFCDMARDLAKRRAPGQESGASFDTAFDQEHEMSRPVLAEDRVHPAVKDRLGGKHKDLVAEVERAIEEHDVVVVGMSQNPHPRR